MDPLSQFAANENKNTNFSTFQYRDLNENQFAESSVNQNHELGQLKEAHSAEKLLKVNEHDTSTEISADKDNSEAEGEIHDGRNHEHDIATSSREIISQTLDGVPPATSEVFNLNSYDMNQSAEDLLAEQDQMVSMLFMMNYSSDFDMLIHSAERSANFICRLFLAVCLVVFSNQLI